MPSQRTHVTVEQLLDDPIVDLLLARDGLTRADVLDVIATARARLLDLRPNRCLDLAA